MRVLSRWMTGAALLAALLTTACLFEDPGEDPPREETLVNDTPANCLRLVERYWNTLDYSQFQPTLAPNFVFYFNPNDVGQTVEGYSIPVSWNAQEMKDAIRNMLTRAYSITMDIPVANLGAPGSGEIFYRTGQVVIELTLLTSPGTGYRLGAGYCLSEFEKYQEEGQDRWRLTKWWDYTRESRDSGPASLGRVLAIFR